MSDIDKAAATRLAREALGNYVPPKRGQFIAAAWIQGASWNQIATLFGVRRETVMSQANKFLSPRLRQQIAYSRPRISYEHLESLHAAWRDLLRTKPHMSKVDAEQIAPAIDALAEPTSMD